jgi:asparagine synthase (glutamine-hydrolysing)
MSGGLDSCSIAAVAQRTLSRNGGSPRLITYSWIFDKLTDCDERAFMGAMAAELGVEIEYIPAERFWFLREPVPLRPSLESPFLWNELVIRQMLARFKERGGRVILTGEAGDSLLRGTTHLFYADRLLRGHIGVLWELGRLARQKGERYHRLLYTHIARPLVPDGLVRWFRRSVGRDTSPQVPDWIAPGFAKRIGLAERLARPPVPRGFRSLARQDTYRLAVAAGVGRAIYWYEDEVARFGLEPRHPFLDRRLVEFVLSIPPEQLFCGDRRKLILRRAMAGILPEDIRQRRAKTMFDSFGGLSLREKEVEQINRLLKGPLLGKMGIVDAERLRSTYENYRAGREVRAAVTLFPPITLELWLRKYYTLTDGGVCEEGPSTAPLAAPAINQGRQ